MEYIKSSSFRQITVPFIVTKIYDKYLNGGVGQGTKFKGRTFKIDNGLKERVWVDGGFEWIDPVNDIPVQTKEDGVKNVSPEKALKTPDFYRTYKKVWDTVIETLEPITITENKKGEEIKKEGTEFTINGLGTFKLQEMLKSNFDFEVPMDGDREAFDWEDNFIKDLIGKKFQMKVTGQGLNTTYSFKEL